MRTYLGIVTMMPVRPIHMLSAYICYGHMYPQACIAALDWHSRDGVLIREVIYDHWTWFPLPYVCCAQQRAEQVQNGRSGVTAAWRRPGCNKISTSIVLDMRLALEVVSKRLNL